MTWNKAVEALRLWRVGIVGLRLVALGVLEVRLGVVGEHGQAEVLLAEAGNGLEDLVPEKIKGSSNCLWNQVALKEI